MSENKTFILPDVITPVSDAIHQNLPETEKQADGALSTVVGFFNNVVLYPVKKANLTFRYKLEAFEDDLKEKIKGIPEENLQIPPTMIAGPTLEALRYTYDESELREMYQNLLAAAMDNRIVSFVHPSYVDTIKQMSPTDAQIMTFIYKERQIPVGRITFSPEKDKYIPDAMPSLFSQDLLKFGDPFLVSQSLINLSRLGLIDVLDSGNPAFDYDIFLANEYVTSRFERYKKKYNELTSFCFEKVIRINDYGLGFGLICLEEEIIDAD
jgi:hypothetical protein